MNKLELLAPAGDLEKVKIAIEYGADAVYFGGEIGSLRASAGNLTLPEIKEAVSYCHDRGKRAYLTVNIYAHNADIEPLRGFLMEVGPLGLDAVIVSDPGVLCLVREIMPSTEIHLSTQANLTNHLSAEFWHKQGVKRIILAREMSLEEVTGLRKNIPDDMEIEAFVQGAMCISYSGRCLLSNFMTGRDANRGACAHPCRYKYRLVEEFRPGEYYPIEEDERGTYIMNSNDLCMIRHIPELINAGVISAKIEGRMKSVFYVATVVAAYRKAIDAYYENPENYVFDESWMEELEKASHREFTTGFFFDKPSANDQNYETSTYSRDYTFVGIVRDYDEKTGYATIEQRNKISVGEEVEFFGPNTDFFTQKLTAMLNADGEDIESAPHAQQLIQIKTEKPVYANYIMRRRN